MSENRCRGEGCQNEARYFFYHEKIQSPCYSDTPWYCGLCDLKHNAGRGKLASEIEAEPSPDRGLLWYREEYMRLDRLVSEQLESRAIEASWDKGIIKNLTAELKTARAEYDDSVAELRSQLKDAHDLGKRLLFERNSFEGMYKNEQTLRERDLKALREQVHAYQQQALDLAAARAAAADYHRDCLSGEAVAAWKTREQTYQKTIDELRDRLRGLQTGIDDVLAKWSQIP